MYPDVVPDLVWCSMQLSLKPKRYLVARGYKCEKDIFQV